MVSPDPEPQLHEFARNLRATREAAGMSQVELAERSGVSLAHVNRLENARREPGMKTIIRLSRAMGTTPSELFRGVE